MEPFLVRAFERVLAVLVGGLSIYLGYRLFLAVKATGEGSAKVKLPSDVTVMVSRVGPGVFFALFGALVVGTSFAFPVSYSETEPPAADQPRIRREISGIGPGLGAGSASVAPTRGAVSAAASSMEALEAERLRVSRHVAFLNQTAALLEAALPEAQRQRARAGTRAAKLQLMRPVWASDWGDIEAFRLWAEGGGPPLDTDEFRAAQRFFSTGGQEAAS